MKISQSAIVSNTDIIKNYKKHRERAEQLGKIVVFKNNRPDAVLFSISEYERVADILEAFENLVDEEASHVIEFIRTERTKMISLAENGLILKKE